MTDACVVVDIVGIQECIGIAPAFAIAASRKSR